MGKEQSSDMAKSLAKELNKKFKGIDQVAYFLGQEESPSDISDWVSTGSSMLDLAVSNKPYGGMPVGRIIEIMGLEASGKSLLAGHIVKSTQKKGGLAVYIDTENAISNEFFEAIGVDLAEMVYVPMDTIEDIFEAVEAIIEQVRKSQKDRLVTIVIDSVMGASTKPETAAQYDKDGWSTAKAIILSKAMRKITNLIGREKILLVLTNQLREKMGVSFGEKYTTSGGKAVGFHSSIRLRMKSVGQIKLKEQVIGIKTRVQVVKNRLGPPLRTIDYDIYFDSGIDDYGSWLTILKNFSIVSQAGAWYTYSTVNKETGEVTDIKFQSKDFNSKVLSDPKIKEEVYLAICDKMILKYKVNDTIGIDDIEYSDEFVGEDD